MSPGACNLPECQTTVGCGHRGPHGEFCYFYSNTPLGCICPPGSEKTCQGALCPRRKPTWEGGR